MANFKQTFPDTDLSFNMIYHTTGHELKREKKGR